MHFEQLPEELLSQILSELDQESLGHCCQLSRLCHGIATQPRLWRKVRIDGRTADAGLTQRLRDWLGGGVREISASRLTAEHGLPLLLAASANLTSLTLHGMDGDPVLTVAGSCCHSLRELRLRSCTRLSVCSVSSLLAGCPQLSLLEYTSSHYDLIAGPTDAGRVFAELFALIRQLNSLSMPLWSCKLLNDLPECPQLNCLHIRATGWLELLQLLGKVPNLLDLNVDIPALLDSQNLLVHRQKLPRLRRIVINSGNNIWSPELVLSLMQSFPELRSFSISCRLSITGREFQQIVRGLPDGLTDLRMSEFECFGVDEAHLAEPLPLGLRRLQLEGSWGRVTGMRLMDALVGCSGLSHLSLGLCSDDLLLALLAQLPRLRCLRLTDCSRLTRRAWAHLRQLESRTASPPDLLEFVALRCGESSLTDEAVADLCASPFARGLQRLCLSGLGQLTDVTLASILSGCPWLTRLGLSFPRSKFGSKFSNGRAAFPTYLDIQLEALPCWTEPLL